MPLADLVSGFAPNKQWTLQDLKPEHSTSITVNGATSLAAFVPAVSGMQGDRLLSVERPVEGLPILRTCIAGLSEATDLTAFNKIFKLTNADGGTKSSSSGCIEDGGLAIVPLVPGGALEPASVGKLASNISPSLTHISRCPRPTLSMPPRSPLPTMN